MRIANITISFNKKFNIGDIVRVNKNAYYYNNKAIVPDWVTNTEWILFDVSEDSDRCVLGIDINGKHELKSAISSKYLKKVKNYEIKYNTYYVKSGDSWQSIAKLNNIDVLLLKKYNNMTDSNILYVGQKIIIPPR